MSANSNRGEDMQGFLSPSVRRALPKSRKVGSKTGQKLVPYDRAGVCRHALADPERSAGALRCARAWPAWDAVLSGRRATAPWWRDTPGRHRAWPRCGEPHARSWTAPGLSGGRPRGCRAPVRTEVRSPLDRRTTGRVLTGVGTKGRGGRVACRPPDGTSGFLEPAPRRCQRLHPRWSDLLRWRPRTGEERHVLQPKAGLASAMGLAPTGPNVAS